MGIGGRVGGQLDIIGAVKMPEWLEYGSIDHDVGAAEVMDVDAEVQDGGDLGDVEGGVGGVPHGDKFSDYKRVTVGRVEMNGRTGGSGAVRQDVATTTFF